MANQPTTTRGSCADLSCSRQVPRPTCRAGDRFCTEPMGRRGTRPLRGNGSQAPPPNPQLDPDDITRSSGVHRRRKPRGPVMSRLSHPIFTGLVAFLPNLSLSRQVCPIACRTHDRLRPVSFRPSHRRRLVATLSLKMRQDIPFITAYCLTILSMLSLVRMAMRSPSPV